MANQIPVVTIDGPSGVGKGTLALMLAARSGWNLLDSGALYRLVALSARRRGVALDDGPALARLAAALDVEFTVDRPDCPGRGVCVFLEGEEATAQIRTETIGDAASRAARIVAVREALLERQRAFRRPPGLFADGRDMGSVIFPDAALKLFLSASPEERARRRYRQLVGQGEGVTMRALFREVQARDQRDIERAASPLRPAADAVVLDTTDRPVEAVAAAVMDLLARRGIREWRNLATSARASAPARHV